MIRRLDRYLGGMFLRWFAVVALAVLGLVYVAELVELIRRGADEDGVTLPLLAQMAGYKVLSTGQRVLPFILFATAMVTLFRLNARQELAVLRAAGVSVWQFLRPLLLCAAMAGFGQLLILNPLAAMGQAAFDRLENTYLGTGNNDIQQNIWLRQRDGDGYAIVHARQMLPSLVVLRDVMVLRFKADGTFAGRLDVREARLAAGQWQLSDGWSAVAGEAPQRVQQLALPTDLTLRQLQDRFATPDTLPFWELPGFIRQLQDAGYAATRHRVYFAGLLATPVLYAVMVLLAAVFALTPPRKRQVLRLLAGGTATGFLLYFAADIVTALGIAGRLPVAMAALVPAAVAGFLALTVLLKREDG